MLRKNYRLRKKREIEKVMKKGRIFKEKFLILKKLNNNQKYFRIAFIVSQKISKKAFLRNKIKRRLREIIKIDQKRIKPGYDLIFLTKKGIEKKDFWNLKKETENLLKKANLLIKK